MGDPTGRTSRGHQNCGRHYPGRDASLVQSWVHREPKGLQPGSPSTPRREEPPLLNILAPREGKASLGRGEARPRLPCA
ncbi:hypothetical protein AVEN_217710-1 [Araneus ventricosus]|uniref:Uncharacterized protein n=1 Tax=Araneus ventricosus TaxID=182803 RepID=A0A4Y2NM82_ARAVE|nr:hypothetical protein AVEN_217710-1 [Araneus ventricosus]